MLFIDNNDNKDSNTDSPVIYKYTFHSYNRLRMPLISFLFFFEFILLLLTISPIAFFLMPQSELTISVRRVGVVCIRSKVVMYGKIRITFFMLSILRFLLSKDVFLNRIIIIERYSAWLGSAHARVCLCLSIFPTSLPLLLFL